MPITVGMTCGNELLFDFSALGAGTLIFTARGTGCLGAYYPFTLMSRLIRYFGFVMTTRGTHSSLLTVLGASGLGNVCPLSRMTRSKHDTVFGVVANEALSFLRSVFGALCLLRNYPIVKGVAFAITLNVITARALLSADAGGIHKLV